MAAPITSKLAAAEGITVPLHGNDPVRPAAWLKITRIGVAAQKHGFLRVGFFPVLQAQGAQITFSSEPPDRGALGDLLPAFCALGTASAIEIERLRISLPAKTGPVMSALKAEPTRQGEWKLTGVTLASASSLQIPEAVLYTQGAQAGTLGYWEAGALRTLDLFH